jgi:hypothetical protein
MGMSKFGMHIEDNGRISSAYNDAELHVLPMTAKMGGYHPSLSGQADWLQNMPAAAFAWRRALGLE